MASINDDFTLFPKQIRKTTLVGGLGLEHDTKTTTKGGSRTGTRNIGIEEIKGGVSA